MNERDFVYWLQGFFEMSEATQLSPKQVQMIKEHLALVMTKKTPSPIRFSQPESKYSIDPSIKCEVTC